MRFALPLLSLVALAGGAYFFFGSMPPSEPDVTCTAEHRTTAVFVDRSASAAADVETRALYATTLRGIIDETLACEGDAVKTFLVHRETDGKAYADRFTSRVAPVDLGELSSGSALTAKSSYSLRIGQERQNALRRALYVADSTVLPRELQMHTDLLGMLSVVREELPAGEMTQRRMVVLSDLNESMIGPGRRDFDVRPPSTSAEAAQWAAADVALVQSVYRVQPTVLAGVEVIPVLGTLASKPAATEVKAYWEALWGALGATEIRW